LISVHRKLTLRDIDAADWNALVRLNATNEPFQTYEWVQCWWEALQSDRELLLLVATDGTRLVGIAPLMLRSSGRGLQRHSVVEFIGTGESDYCDFIIAAEHKEPVLRAIVEYLDNEGVAWDALSLQNIPDRSDTVPILEGVLSGFSFKVRKRRTFLCPTLLIKDDPDFADQCTKKKSLRRHYNYFNRTGELVFQKVQTIEEIDQCMDDFFMQHFERRAIAGGQSKFDDRRVREFYRCLASRALPAGWLRFATVKLDGIPIAYHFGFEYCGKFTWYKPTFNVDYIHKSPGEVLIKFLLEDAIQNGIEEFDFTIGDEGFKRRFANKIRENFQLDIVRSRRLWLISTAALQGKSFLKNRFPKLIAAFRRFFDKDRWLDFGPSFTTDLTEYGKQTSGMAGAGRALRRLLFDVERTAWYTRDDRLPVKPGVPMSIREGKISDARGLERSMAPNDRRRLISRWYGRLRSGDQLYVAMDTGRLIFSAWVDSETGLVDEFHIMEDSDGQSDLAVALYWLAEHLRAKSDTSVLVAGSSRPAEKNKMQCAGFRMFKTVTRICLLGIRMSWQTAVEPKDA
jgi:CelD/BcsL family acetyltransferase involved in cellulose biosynthesis